MTSPIFTSAAFCRVNVAVMADAAGMMTDDTQTPTRHRPIASFMSSMVHDTPTREVQGSSPIIHAMIFFVHHDVAAGVTE